MPSRPSFQMLGSQLSDHSCLWRWRQSAHLRQVRAQLHTEGRVLQKGALEKRLPCWDLGHQASHQLRVSKLLFKRKQYIILFIKMGNFSSWSHTDFVSSSISVEGSAFGFATSQPLGEQWSYPTADSNHTSQSFWFFFLKICKQIRNRKPLLPGRVQTHTGRRTGHVTRETSGPRAVPPAARAQSLSDSSLYLARMAWPFWRGISS